MRKTPVNQALLQCERCSNVFPIWRKRSKLMAVGHIKHLYCYVCKMETAHFEIREEYLRNLRELVV